MPLAGGAEYESTFTGAGYASPIARAFIDGAGNDIEDYNTFIGYYDVTFSGQYSGAFVSNYTNNLNQNFQSGGDLTFQQFAREYVPQYMDAYLGNFGGPGVRNYTAGNVWVKNISYVGPYFQPPIGSPLPPIDKFIYSAVAGVLYGNSWAKSYTNTQTGQTYLKHYIGGYSGGLFQGPRSYIKAFENDTMYQSTVTLGYMGQEYEAGGSPPSPFPEFRPDDTEYVGTTTNTFRRNYHKNYSLGPYNATYEGTFDFTYIGNTIVVYTQQYSKEYEGAYQKQYEGTFEGAFDKQYEGGYDKSYIKTYHGQYTKTYHGQYEGFFNKTYIGNYTKEYVAQYEGLRTSTSTFVGSYVGYFDGISYEGFFNGITYIGNYTKTYTGQYEGQFSKQYSGVYEGTFNKQYEGSFTRNYIKQWSGTYTKTYTGVYSGGPYNTQYTGLYTKTYLGLYTKTYLGLYSQLFEGAFNKQYEGTFAGQYTKTYTGQYTKTYLGQYTKTYTGIYIKQYTDGYIKQYSKEYEGVFTKQYLKTYGGAWSGQGPAYLGLAYFTNSYTGLRTFAQTYTGLASASTISSLQAGNLDESLVRVKIGGAYKSVQRTRVKEDNQWKIVQSTRIKKDGEWKLVGSDFERVEFNITSNTANFNLGNELTALGFDLYDKPKHVNIILANDVYVYSANSTPALDTSLLTGSQGVNHKVKILLKSGSRVVGMGGSAGQTGYGHNDGMTGSAGGNGGDAILLRNGVDLYVESYGTIAGGGGGGGAGGNIINNANPDHGNPLGVGGKGAGWHSSGFVAEDSSQRNGTNDSKKYFTHGGNGGLLGQLGIAAGGFLNPPRTENNPGTNYAQYARSGNGGLPGSAIKGYDASRVTFINSTEGSVWGDSAFKFKA